METMQPKIKTLSNRAVAKLTVEKDTVFWDRDLTGFGVRVYPTGAKVYVAQARGPEGPKRVAVGRHGVIHADEARKRAAHIIARIKAGEEAIPKPRNPAGGPTVAELAERYLTEYVSVRCKPRTVKTVRSLVLKHIVPALGKLSLTSVERAHVAEMHQRLSATPAAANQAVRALSAMKWWLLRCAYPTVLRYLLFPKCFPTKGRFSPDMMAWLAIVWRKSCSRSLPSPTSTRILCQ